MGNVKPIFEIRYPGMDKHYKIYEDGRIEGFEDGAAIVNRIFPRIAELEAKIVVTEMKTRQLLEIFRVHHEMTIALGKESRETFKGIMESS